MKYLQVVCQIFLEVHIHTPDNSIKSFALLRKRVLFALATCILSLLVW